MSHGNVLGHPFNPIGSHLSGMVGHPRQNLRWPRRVAYKRADVDLRPDTPVLQMYKRPRIGTRYAKRPRRTRRRRGLRRKPIPRALTTNTKLIRCKAVSYQNYTPAGTLTRVPVQLNSIDDPFVSNGNEQPLGYDQWKALYKYAYVVGSKVTVKAHNNGTVAAMIGITPCKIDQGTTALTSFDHYMELPGTKSRVLSQETDHCTFAHQVSVKKFLSIKDIRDNDDYRVVLAAETPPSTIAYWHVWSQAMDATGTIDIDVVLTAEYLVLLTDPIIPSRSTET